MSNTKENPYQGLSNFISKKYIAENPYLVSKREIFQPNNAYFWLLMLGILIGIADSCGSMLPIIISKIPYFLIMSPFLLFTLIFNTLVIIYLLDRYYARRPWVLFLAFLAGGFISGYISALANEDFGMALNHLLHPFLAKDWNAIAGPFTEEYTKGLSTLLVILLASATTKRPLAIMLVGGFVGLGFQVVEDISYLVTSLESIPDDNTLYDAFVKMSETIGVRTITGIASHWLYTMVLSLGLAYLLNRCSKKIGFFRRIFRAMIFILLPLGLHFYWNSPFEHNTLDLVLQTLLAIFVLFIALLYAYRDEKIFLEKAIKESDFIADHEKTDATIAVKNKNKELILALNREDRKELPY